MKQDADKHGVYYDEKQQCFCFKSKTKDDYQKQWAKNEELRMLYGIDCYDTFHSCEGWLDFEKYAEFEQFWAKCIQEAQGQTKEFVHAPFIISDFQHDTKFTPLHHGKLTDENEDFEYTKAETINWYINCAHEATHLGTDIPANFRAVYNKEDGCTHCCYENDRKKCNHFLSDIRIGKLTSKNITHTVLGGIAILSECHYMPSYVVERLYKVCNFACDHMG